MNTTRSNQVKTKKWKETELWHWGWQRKESGAQDTPTENVWVRPVEQQPFRFSFATLDLFTSIGFNTLLRESVLKWKEWRSQCACELNRSTTFYYCSRRQLRFSLSTSSSVASAPHSLPSVLATSTLALLFSSLLFLFSSFSQLTFPIPLWRFWQNSAVQRIAILVFTSIKDSHEHYHTSSSKSLHFQWKGLLRR